MNTHPVFFDPHGKRQRFLTRFTALGGLTAAVLTTAFWLSLLVIPLLPRVPWLSGTTASRRALLPEMPRRERHVSRYLLRRSRAQLYREIARTQPARMAATIAAVPPAIVAAFYAPWQETGLHSLRAHAAGLTHLMPEWLHLKRTGDGLDTRDWNPASTPHNRDVLQIARAHHLQIMPILNNSEGGFFDPQRVHRLLASPVKQRRLALALRGWLQRQRFQGVNLDMENLQAADYPRLIPLLRIFRQTLNPAGLALSVDVEAGNETLPLHALADTCTFVVMMAYDQHYAGGTPGPVASISWTQQVLARAVQALPADKLVLGIGNYAYDWPTHGPAESLTYQDALIRARDYGGDTGAAHLVNFDPVALNPTFNYTDDQGRAHEVWMLDAVTAYNQWLLGNRMHLRGAAVWALGSEDPSLWSFLRRDRLSHLPTAETLATVQFPYDVEYEGEGEILAVRFRPQQGRRTLETDTRTGLITDMDYQSFPASFVIRREGYQRRKIALTFDDGPDPVYTPRILSVLHRYHVPATFFMIGESADAHPALVRQVWEAGHEIGSHTFTHPNMGAVSDRRGTLELNTTQRALQSILGRSTVLFRPPLQRRCRADQRGRSKAAAAGFPAGLPYHRGDD